MNRPKEQVPIRLKSFVNGSKIIENVPYFIVDCPKGLRSSKCYLTPSVLRRLAFITKRMEDEGLEKYDYGEHGMKQQGVATH